MKKIAAVIATLGPIGYSRWAPGTLGSLVAVLLVPLMMKSEFYILLTLIFFIVGIWASQSAATQSSIHDPSFVIFDEVCGILTSFLFVPISIYSLITGFLLFRFFDIAKPLPIRHLERLPGGFGIVMDDVGAGIYTNLILQVLFRYASF